MKRAIDPIFAPVTYGDDRQVTRTRRGLNSICEMQYSPLIVYCTCLSCKYKWEVTKTDYIGGTGGTSPRIAGAKHREELGYEMFGTIPDHIGIGGTGTPALFNWAEYGAYDTMAHECCTGGMGLCAYQGQEVKVADYYPLTGGTGGDGLLDSTSCPELSYDVHGQLIGPTESECLGDSTSIYMTCSGGSGSFAPRERAFGGYPLVCPNCCRVNFQALYREPKDNPGKKDVQFDSNIVLKNNWQFEAPVDRVAEIKDITWIQDPCKNVIVIDFQRVKSDFNATG